MKKILIVFGLIMPFFQTNGQGLSIVRDPYVKLQLENMVFIRWGKFRPKWYYFVFHNKYRRGPDRRTLLQLVPTDAVGRITKEKSQEEAEEVEELFHMQNWDALNRSMEIHYHLHFKPTFEDLNADIDQLIHQVTTLNSDPGALQSFVSEQERLNGEIEIIRKGWLEASDSAGAMSVIVKDLRSLKGKLMKFVKLQSIKLKYLNIQP